ncbi:MAG: CBS domain-containing protein [Elusimicrobia bacterium]|nr:CBS domain-containing protein [Elusimicrobiota bacterium]
MPHTARLLVRDVITVKGGETVTEAAKIMRENRIGCVIVAEDERPVGIFTERDLLNKIVAAGLDPAKVPVSRFMTANPTTVDASEPLDKVFATLAQGLFRHLPITEHGKLVGIISLTDIAGILREVFLQDQYTQYLVDYLQTGGQAGARK